MVRLARLDGVGMSHRVEDRPLPGFDAPLTPLERRRHKLLVGVFLVSALAAGATWFFQPSWLDYLDHPITFWDDEPGYTRYIAHDHEWTLRFPDNWYAFHIAEHPPRHGRHRSSTFGVFISNVGVSEEDVWAEGMPADVVAVRVAYDHPGGPLFGEGACDHDTRLPLELSNASSSNARVRDEAGGAVRAFWLPFALNGEMLHSVRVWFGSQASEPDRTIAQQIIGSIRYAKSFSTDPSLRPPPQGFSAYRCFIEDQFKKVGGKVS